MEDKDKDNLSVVGMIRDKNEELDLNGILKTTFGGYTKQSVHEYLAILRKQQQTSQATFSGNLQNLFEEKENIKKSHDTLLARYNKLSAEYDNLAETLKNVKIEDSEFSAKNVIILKNNIISLEEEVKVANREKKSVQKEIEHLNNDISNLNIKLEQSMQETEAQKAMLKAERAESKKLRDTVADLSRMLEEEKNEVKYLKGTMTDGKYAELNSKIGELSAQMTAQTEIIKKQNSECNLKEKTIDSFSDEIAMLKQKLGSMTKCLQDSNTQNDKLLVANEALKYQLQEEYKKSIELINEKSNIAIDRLIAQKNLSTAEAKITSLEMQLLKQKKSDDIKILQNKQKEESSDHQGKLAKENA